jgi:hypothetical protein
MIGGGEMTNLFIASGKPASHPQRIPFMGGRRDQAIDLSTIL